MLWMKSQHVNIQMKATEQCLSELMFIMHNKMIFTFESVDECDHPFESFWAAVSTIKLVLQLVKQYLNN